MYSMLSSCTYLPFLDNLIIKNNLENMFARENNPYMYYDYM